MREKSFRITFRFGPEDRNALAVVRAARKCEDGRNRTVSALVREALHSYADQLRDRVAPQ